MQLGRFVRVQRAILVGFLLILIVIGSWQYGPAVQEFVRDRERFQQFVTELGWLGPIALICFNALQIIVAPVPGYIVQLAAGFLYGPWWGGLWSSCGLFIGSMSAMWLARTFGRPLVERVIGANRLHHWEEYIHSDNIYIWFILLLGPTGDAPYYLAGLSQIRFFHIVLITLLIRVPSVFVAAAVGAGVFALRWWQFALIIALFGVLAFILLRHKDRISSWMDHVLQTLVRRQPPEYTRSSELELSTSSDE